jgi:hypothetical protein
MEVFRWSLDHLTNWKYFGRLSLILLLGDALLGSIIIFRVPYTEIDWVAYMQVCRHDSPHFCRTNHITTAHTQTHR